MHTLRHTTFTAKTRLIIGMAYGSLMTITWFIPALSKATSIPLAIVEWALAGNAAAELLTTAQPQYAHWVKWICSVALLGSFLYNVALLCW